MHEPKLYAAEGPVTGHEGKFTVASVGCTCGWNSDGKAWNKEGDWHAHLPKLAAPATPLSEEQVRVAVEQSWGKGSQHAYIHGLTLRLNALLRQPAEAERDRRVPFFGLTGPCPRCGEPLENHKHSRPDGCMLKISPAEYRQYQRGFRAAKEMAAQVVEQHNRDLMERWNEVTKEPPLEAKIRSLEDAGKLEKR